MASHLYARDSFFLAMGAVGIVLTSRSTLSFGIFSHTYLESTCTKYTSSTVLVVKQAQRESDIINRSSRAACLGLRELLPSEG